MKGLWLHWRRAPYAHAVTLLDIVTGRSPTGQSSRNVLLCILFFFGPMLHTHSHARRVLLEGRFALLHLSLLQHSFVLPMKRRDTA